MATNESVRAAKRILNHLDEEAFPNPLANIIDQEYSTLRAKVAELEAKLAEYREDLIGHWDANFESDAARRPGGWRIPYTSAGRGAAKNLYEAGLLEKHPTEDWYRWVKKEADNA